MINLYQRARESIRALGAYVDRNLEGLDTDTRLLVMNEDMTPLEAEIIALHQERNSQA